MIVLLFYLFIIFCFVFGSLHKIENFIKFLLLAYFSILVPE